MKILITADLHYDVARSRQPAESLAERVCAEGGDALVLVGDTAGSNLDVFRCCLRLFREFPGRKLLVAGNHELWRRDGESSLDRYERQMPEAAAAEGFEVLDVQPVILGKVGLVGSMGWYDYSLRDESLGIPLDFYRHKVSPGAADYLGEYEELLAVYRDVLTERHMRIGARWMDGWRVELGMSDEEFLDRLIARLEGQLDAVSPQVDRIVAFVHHLPCAGLVPKHRPDRFAFAAAFLGSDRIGQTLLRFNKVKDIYCGHSHWPGQLTLDGVNVVNVGSTYVEKRLDVLEIQ